MPDDDITATTEVHVREVFDGMGRPTPGLYRCLEHRSVPYSATLVVLSTSGQEQERIAGLWLNQRAVVQGMAIALDPRRAAP